MRSDQAKTIPIHEYLLTVEGIKHAHTRLNGKEYWYQSPLRSGDKTPSFKVDTVGNVWFDHGLSEGGKIIDLVCKLRNVTVRDALQILEQSELYRGGVSSPVFSGKNSTALFKVTEDTTQQKRVVSQKSAIEKEKSEVGNAYEILDTRSLSHPALLQYVDSRCIDGEIAQQYLDEVHFKHTEKLAQYYALGWKNGKGYEVRNKYFKGFIGTGKSISVLNLESHSEWLVFEGFMDFLSYLTYVKQQKNTTTLSKGVVILNSTALRKQLLAQIEQHQPSKLYCFFDNDDAGKDAYDFFHTALSAERIQDMSSLYSGAKDFNEWLCQQSL